MRTKIYFLIGVVLLAALLTSCAGAAYAQSTTPTSESVATVTRTLNVSGSGIAYLSPDIAYVNIGVHTEGKNAAEAVAANNSQADKVVNAIKKLGVKDKDIQTTNFSISPQPVYDDQGKPTGEIDYSVDNVVRVTVRDLSQIGDLLDAVVAAGANSINGIQFDVVDRTQALSDARQAAMQAAQAKAQELAKAAGVTLGEIQTIIEYSGNYPTPMYSASSGPLAAEAAAAPISPGQMTVTVEVNVVYEIK
jgi:uncharacterized protein YggE